MTKDEALRLALEALSEAHYVVEHRQDVKKREQAINAIKAALEAKAEPVAVWELFEDGWNSIADPEWMESLPVGTRLYTTPSQRTWVGLTGEEIEASKPTRSNDAVVWELAVEWAEAKLKEKNT